METNPPYQAQFAEPDSLFVEVDGFRLHYKRFGSGPTLILLLHGSFLSLRSWREVTQPLAQQATVVAFDRPVCGLTSRPLPQATDPSPYSADAQADLVAHLIEALGFQQAVLVGSSTGGTIAVLTALRHPQRVRALVLVGAMIFSGYATSEVPAPVLAMMKGLRPLFSRIMKLMIVRLYDKAIRKFWHHQERLPGTVIQTYKQEFMLGPWDQAFFELFLATRRLHLDGQLGRIGVPTLVITGEHDRAVKPDESRRLASEIPGASLAVIPDCGHLPQEECPDAFLTAIQGFLLEASRLAPSG
ncbi:alpha/beta fold hydrolase [Thiocystis violacea]|uniref:alpha/beta fold hydrolase n=1 Tax=Thiocystis violacea TaxID=13725 RepID=UPI0019051B86|nr:alpha/beta hydrolase [Thiocystis violacea]MBK1720859.1 alpha/beta hydrolase [Thiocystis violacea]